MNIHAVKTDRMDITIDLASRYVFVQQKWRYNWLIDPKHPNQSTWTIEEKRNFHNKSDQIIWKLWSTKAYLMMRGGSTLAQQYRNVKFPVHIDIKWVTGSENTHWKVNVYKIPAGTIGESGVRWGDQQIILDSKDYKARTDKIAPGQYPVSHELGHTFKNESGLYPNRRFGTLDEYKRTKGVSDSRYHSDRGSIMNIGNDVRERHYAYLKEQLNRLLPTAMFEVYV